MGNNTYYVERTEEKRRDKLSVQGDHGKVQVIKIYNTLFLNIWNLAFESCVAGLTILIRQLWYPNV